MKGFLLYHWGKYFTFMKGKRCNYHESLSFAKVHATEVGVDIVAISVIIYFEVLIVLLGFMTIKQNIFIEIKL